MFFSFVTLITDGEIAFGCLTDFMCVLVPIFILHNLQMNKRTKAAMILVFSLGLL